MARYIDEKDVYKLVEPSGTARVHCSQIDELPRADVVPKSEFDKLLISKETDIHISMEKLVKVRTEHPIFKAIEEKVAREIFEEIEKVVNRYCKDYKYSIADVLLDIAELKKKYTEGEE